MNFEQRWKLNINFTSPAQHYEFLFYFLCNVLYILFWGSKYVFNFKYFIFNFLFWSSTKSSKHELTESYLFGVSSPFLSQYIDDKWFPSSTEKNF